jgi:HD superfamily phosphohydrolase
MVLSSCEKKKKNEKNENSVPADQKFLYQIVANKTNSVDVDKFDYIARDCFNTGHKSSYDYSRLMSFSKVVNGEICFQSKEVIFLLGDWGCMRALRCADFFLNSFFFSG